MAPSSSSQISPTSEVPLSHLCQDAFPDRHNHSKPLPSSPLSPELLNKHIQVGSETLHFLEHSSSGPKAVFLLTSSFLLMPSPPIPVQNHSQSTPSNPTAIPSLIYSFIYFFKNTVETTRCQILFSAAGIRQ